jgi:hypothetical protein
MVVCRVEQCEDSPCLNGALCLVEEDLFRCYCVPDYHGKRCQFKYNECQLPPGENYSYAVCSNLLLDCGFTTWRRGRSDRRRK